MKKLICLILFASSFGILLGNSLKKEDVSPDSSVYKREQLMYAAYQAYEKNDNIKAGNLISHTMQSIFDEKFIDSAFKEYPEIADIKIEDGIFKMTKERYMEYAFNDQRNMFAPNSAKPIYELLDHYTSSEMMFNIYCGLRAKKPKDAEKFLPYAAALILCSTENDIICNNPDVLKQVDYSIAIANDFGDKKTLLPKLNAIKYIILKEGLFKEKKNEIEAEKILEVNKSSYFAWTVRNIYTLSEMPPYVFKIKEFKKISEGEKKGEAFIRKALLSGGQSMKIAYAVSVFFSEGKFKSVSEIPADKQRESVPVLEETLNHKKLRFGAMFALPAVYLFGDESLRNPERAIEILEANADENYRCAAALFLLYHDALAGVKQDTDKAEKYFEKALNPLKKEMQKTDIITIKFGLVGLLYLDGIIGWPTQQDKLEAWEDEAFKNGMVGLFDWEIRKLTSDRQEDKAEKRISEVALKYKNQFNFDLARAGMAHSKGDSKKAEELLLAYATTWNSLNDEAKAKLFKNTIYGDVWEFLYDYPDDKKFEAKNREFFKKVLDEREKFEK